MNSLIDLNHLESLKEIEGNHQLTKELMQIFFNQSPDDVKSMHLAYKNNELEHLSRLSHSFKSSSGNIGATSLSQASYKIEKCILIDKCLDLNTIKKLLSEFDLLYNKSIIELKKIYEALE